MAPEELKALARRLPEELLTQGDLKVADEIFALNELDGGPGQCSSGNEALKRWITELRRAFPDLYAIVEEEIADGDKVVQRLTLIGTHQDAYLNVPSAGRCATWQMVTIQRMGANKKFTEYWTVADNLNLLQQLGVRL